MRPPCGLASWVLAAGQGLRQEDKIGEQITAQDEMLFCSDGPEDPSSGLQAGSGAWLKCY